MEPIINIYKAALYLLAQEAKRSGSTSVPVLDIRTLAFYWAEKMGEGQNDIQLFPVGDNSPTNIEYDMSPEFFVSLDDFAEISGKRRKLSGKFADVGRKIAGLLADVYRKSSGGYAEILGVPTGTLADVLRTDGGASTETKRTIIGKGHIDRNSVSQLYTGEVHNILKKIEQLANQIVQNTTKEKTIQSTAQRFDEAVKVIEGKELNKIEKLRKIQASLQLTRDRQLQRHEQNTEEAIRSNPVRKLKVWAAAAAMVVLVGLIGYKLLFNQDTEFRINETASLVMYEERKLFTTNEIYEKIKLVSSKNNLKIWDWRKNKIIEAANGKQMTDKELISLVENIALKEY